MTDKIDIEEGYKVLTIRVDTIMKELKEVKEDIKMIMLCRSCEGFIVIKKIGEHEWQCPKCRGIIWGDISSEDTRLGLVRKIAVQNTIKINELIKRHERLKKRILMIDDDVTERIDNHINKK